MSKCHQYTKGDDHRWWMRETLRCLSVTSIRKVMIKSSGCLVKPRCLNVTSIRKVMIIGGGCVKPRCLNVTSMRKVMIKGGGYLTT